MAQNPMVWKRLARVRLLEQLGGKCVDCGTAENLTFDHILPLSDEQASWRTRMGSTARMCMYRREALEGLLTIRCMSCNSGRGRKEPKQGSFTFASVLNAHPF